MICFIKRLAYILLFFPMAMVSSVYDTILFLFIGEEHRPGKALDWLDKKLLGRNCA